MNMKYLSGKRGPKLSLMALHKLTISTFMCEIICLLEIGGCTCLIPRGCIMGGHK